MGHHATPGGGTKISGFMMSPRGCERSDVSSTFTRIDVSPPAHCNYFFATNAVVPLFEKLCASDCIAAQIATGTAASVWAGTDKHDSLSNAVHQLGNISASVMQMTTGCKAIGECNICNTKDVQDVSDHSLLPTPPSSVSSLALSCRTSSSSATCLVRI